MRIDARFRAAIDAQLARADAAVEPGMWLTYAIHDPSKPDTVGGEGEGLILYVGQTRQFAKRVRKHLRVAGAATRRPADRVDGACYDVMTRGAVPHFSVRERTHTAIDSLVSETNLARRLIAAGYPLVNRWPLQRTAGPAIDRMAVPHAWLWPLTARDAIDSGIDLIARDPETGTALATDLAAFPSTMRLSAIRAALKARGLRCRLHVRP